MGRGKPPRLLPFFCLLMVSSACRLQVEPAHAKVQNSEQEPHSEIDENELNHIASNDEKVDHEETEIAKRERNYITPEISEGSRQSPINISTRTRRRLKKRGRVKINYKSSEGRAVNLGHTIKVNYGDGSVIEHQGQQYILKQYHFHTPSEHLIDGVTYPMEMHLVHVSKEDPEEYLVIGILFKEGKASGIVQSTIDTVIDEEVGQEISTEERIKIRRLFRKTDGYYVYKGSLTTPPYTEKVQWLVRDRIHEASTQQIRVINRLEGNNARDIQDINRRQVVHLR